MSAADGSSPTSFSIAEHNRAVSEEGTAAPTPTVQTVPNPWRGYLTSVTPNGTLAFADSTVGYMVTGQGPGPVVDHFLSSGEPSNYWPGTGVAVSHDSGQSWTSSLSDPTGIWGVDAYDTSTAWAVGVTKLYGTTDGGASWSTLGEPATSHLVEVSFSSPLDGLALDTGGKSFTTSDGGDHWSPSSAALGTPLIASCAGPNGEYFASAPNGDIWLLPTTQSPQTFHHFTDVAAVGSGQELQCGTGTPTIWASRTSAVDPGTGQIQIAFDRYDGSGWSGIANPLPETNLPSGRSEILASGAGSLAFVAALSQSSATSLDVASTTDSGNTFHTTVVSGLPTGPFAASRASSILGACVLPNSTEWFTVATGSRSSPGGYELTLFRSTDSGATWSAVYQQTVAAPTS